MKYRLLIFILLFMVGCVNHQDVKSEKSRNIIYPVPNQGLVSLASLKKVHTLQPVFNEILVANHTSVKKATTLDGILYFLGQSLDGFQVFSIDLNDEEKVIGYGSIGDGPEQYRNAYDFYIHDSKVVLLCEGNVIKEYDLKGTYLGQRPTPIPMATSFARVGNREILYSSAGNLSDPFRLWWFEAGKEKAVRKELPFNSEGSRIPIDGIQLFSKEANVYFSEPFSSVVYELASNKLDTSFRFDFGEYAFAEDFYAGDAMQIFLQLRKSGFFTILRYFENKTHAYFFIESQMPPNTVSQQNLLIDKNNPGDPITFNEADEEVYVGGAVGLTETGQLIFPIIEEGQINGSQAEVLQLHFVEVE
jgi:hypothetical protein